MITNKTTVIQFAESKIKEEAQKPVAAPIIIETVAPVKEPTIKPIEEEVKPEPSFKDKLLNLVKCDCADVSAE